MTPEQHTWYWKGFNDAKQSTECVGEPDLDAICQDLQEKTYTQAMRIAELEEALAQSQSDVKQEQPYADKAASVSNDRIKIDPVTGNVQIGAAKQEQRSDSEQLGEPVAVVDANDDGYWAEILPDRSVKVGQLLYTTPYVATQRQQRPFIKPLTDEQCDAIYNALDEWAREIDSNDFGLPVIAGDGAKGARPIIRSAHGITEE